jgi:hypothetical protein
MPALVAGISMRLVRRLFDEIAGTTGYDAEPA